jgi:CRISPR-associated protein Csd2
MSVLQKKIDFIALVSVSMANCNGDPLNGNRPRTDYNGFGEISDVCIKRKIRNRMQDMGNSIFIQAEDRPGWDQKKSLKERADQNLPTLNSNSKDEYAKKACKKWLDVRSFGQLFAFSGSENGDGGVSVGVRGPVSVHHAISISPVNIRTFQITKSVNGNPKDKKSSDTMGMKHFVRFGLYEIKGSINVQLAEKTGFTEEDAETVKECLRTLFVNDASSARPDGSMEVVKLYWFQHNCKEGQYSSAKVHRSLKVALKKEKVSPSCVEDYEITLEPLDGLVPEVIDGL